MGSDPEAKSGVNDIPPEAELAYTCIGVLEGQPYAKANAVAQEVFRIMEQHGLMLLEEGRMVKSARVREIEQAAKDAHEHRRAN